MIIFDLDSTPVELTGRVQVLENGDLLISNVRESDAGWYSCVRSNEAGSVTGQAYLGVMGMYGATTIHETTIELLNVSFHMYLF